MGRRIGLICWLILLLGVRIDDTVGVCSFVSGMWGGRLQSGGCEFREMIGYWQWSSSISPSRSLL